MPTSSPLASIQDIQSRSKTRSAMEGQGHLLLSRTPREPSIGEEVVFAQRNFSGAISLAVAASGLDDKEVYIPLGIDPSHWTKIKKGEAHFPVDKLNDFCDLVGNEIVLQWWAHSRGKGLHMLLTEAERLLAEERAAREKAEAENRILRDVLQGRA